MKGECARNLHDDEFSRSEAPYANDFASEAALHNCLPGCLVEPTTA